MSQEKVNKYKEEKKNRKKHLQQEKKRQKFFHIFGPILTLLVIAALGAGIYFIPKLTNQAVSAQTSEEAIDTDALMDLINASLSGNDTTDSGTDDTDTADTDTTDTDTAE